MIYEQADRFIEEILQMTKENKLIWQPIENFFNSEKSHSQAGAQLSIFCKNEYVNMIADDSFYLEKKDHLLFIIHAERESAIDGRITDDYALEGIIHNTDECFTDIPDFHAKGNEGRLEKIVEAIKENQFVNEAKNSMPQALYNFFQDIITGD